MRLIDSRGAVKDIVEALPVIEARRIFNLEEKADIEICKDVSVKPNGIYFTFAEKDPSTREMGLMGDTALAMRVGNLKPKVAEKILSDLARNGVADISGFPYQERKMHEKDYIFDNGESAAYCSYYYDPFEAGFVVPNSYKQKAMGIYPKEECSGEDLSNLSDEELRKTIYDLGDYTFKELGAMSREELEEEYNNLEVEE